jgi:hypothetical protein
MICSSAKQDEVIWRAHKQPTYQDDFMNISTSERVSKQPTDMEMTE